MRVAVMGAGSIGGYFGGMLAQGGHQVTLIARGAHLKAIKERGLTVVTEDGVFTAPCDATDDPAEVGTVDLALLTVKTYHNQQAVPAMRPLVGNDTTVLCLQNGVDSYEAAATILGNERVMPGAAYIEASLPEPGTVRQNGRVVRIVFGEADGRDSQRGRQLRQALEESGVPVEFSRDIKKTLWTKFLFIATMAGITTMTRETLAQLLPRAEWRKVVVGCLEEIERVGRARGVALDSQVVADTLAYIEGFLEQMHASMHSDIMAGRPLELEALNGAVVREGEKAGVPTPINDLIYAMLLPYRDGSQART